MPDAFALVGAALIRQAAILDPFDREKLRLADDISAKVPNRPFGLWLAMAKDLTKQDPLPENVQEPVLAEASLTEIVDWLNAQPSNAMRYHVMLKLWHTGAFEPFEQAVQIMSASPSGLLAAPVMAWGAYFAGKPLLAEMLLEEGVPAFPGHNLRAHMAFENGEKETAVHHLQASLVAEPLQPFCLMALRNQQTIADTHVRLGKRMSMADLETTNTEPTGNGLGKAVEELLPTLPQVVGDFWKDILPYLL